MMKKKYPFIILSVVFISMIVLITGGNYYIESMRYSVWNQSVSDVLEVTSQGSHAFEVYLQKDIESLSSLANNLSLFDSNDKNSILKKIESFDDAETNFRIIDLKHGLQYSSRSISERKLTKDEINEYSERPESGILEPYINEYTGENTLGYYERFTFADGAYGIVQKGHLLSDVAEEFSLSFYNDTGFSYIINNQGDILIRSNHKNSNQTFTNLFEVIENENDNNETIKTFHDGITDEKEGVARFIFENEEHIFAFVPISDTDGWYLISIIPNSVIMKNANQILNTSQLFILIIGTSFLITVLFVVLFLKYRKSIKAKDVEIKYQEQLFNILANNTNDLFLMLSDSDFSVKYVSPNVERVLGVSKEDAEESVSALGRASYENDKTVDYDDLKNIHLGDSVAYNSMRIHKKTNERKYYVETIYHIIIEDTNGYIITISDRTLEQQNEQTLQEALNIAKAANESKNLFLSNMSHDIRTPMNAIMGLTTLLQHDADNPDRVREHTYKIKASSQHLLGLINDVLDMSKIESGKTTLNLTEIDLTDIINELENIIRPQAKAKNQKFEIFTHNIITEHLQGDKLKINQILLNILSNAVKYTPVGGSIEMTVQQLPQITNNNAFLRFIIKDNGIGMSEEYLKIIFQPFSREINSATDKTQGTGLGMSITKNLVDLMGGTILVESEQGKGSIFTVELELRILNKQNDQYFWKQNNIESILVVDDEIEIFSEIQNAMLDTGVSVHFASNGQSAVETVENAYRNNQKFDIILLNWKMPDIDGIETADRIRSVLDSETPIMILTAYDWTEVDEQGFKAGIKGFLQKPFFMNNFKQTIKSIKSREKMEINKADNKALSGLHCLAAEDNDLNFEILSELLSMHGATCDHAQDGREALKKFEESKPKQYDLILMDIQMPNMNGYEAAKAIRKCKHPQAKTIPIIAMTANAFADDINDAIHAGMNAHIAKPIDMELMISTLKEQLDANAD